MKNTGIAFLIVSSLSLTACAGGNAIDDGVPQAAFGEAGPPAQSDFSSTQSATGPDGVFSGSGEARQTGTYPNINRVPSGAAPQLTDDQSKLLVAEMQALSLAHSRGQVSTAEYNRRLAVLRQLAATHSDAVLEIIEN